MMYYPGLDSHHGPQLSYFHPPRVDVAPSRHLSARHHPYGRGTSSSYPSYNSSPYRAPADLYRPTTDLYRPTADLYSAADLYRAPADLAPHPLLTPVAWQPPLYLSDPRCVPSVRKEVKPAPSAYCDWYGFSGWRPTDGFPTPRQIATPAPPAWMSSNLVLATPCFVPRSPGVAATTKVSGDVMMSAKRQLFTPGGASTPLPPSPVARAAPVVADGRQQSPVSVSSVATLSPVSVTSHETPVCDVIDVTSDVIINVTSDVSDVREMREEISPCPSPESGYCSSSSSSRPSSPDLEHLRILVIDPVDAPSTSATPAITTPSATTSSATTSHGTIFSSATPATTTTTTPSGSERVRVRTERQKKKYQCLHCSKSYRQARCLDYHFLACHQGSAGADLTCSVCDVIFTHPSSLRVHMRRHTGERPYTCPHCPQRFSDPSVRRRHVRTHTSERPFACYACAYRATQSGNLKRHLRSVHGVVV